MVYKGNFISKWMIWGTFILRTPTSQEPRPFERLTILHFAPGAGRGHHLVGKIDARLQHGHGSMGQWFHTQQLDFFENWQQNNLLKSEG